MADSQRIVPYPLFSAAHGNRMTYPYVITFPQQRLHQQDMTLHICRMQYIWKDVQHLCA